MKRHCVILLLIALLLISFASPVFAHAQAKGAFIRFIHLTGDMPAVKLALSGKTVVDPIEFGEVSAYVKVDPGTYKFLVQVPDAPAKPDAGAEFAVADGKYYSFMIVGQSGNQTAIPLFVDEMEMFTTVLGGTLPDRTMPFLFVPAFGGGDPVDVYVNGKQYLKEVKFGAMSIAAVPLGIVEIKVTKAGDANTVLASTDTFVFNNVFGVFGFAGPSADKLGLTVGITTPESILAFLKAQSQTSLDTIRFNSLLLAATTAKLTDTLDKGGPFTLLAPNDNAFAAVYGDDLKKQEEAFKAAPDKIAQQIKLHIIDGRFTMTSITGLIGQNKGTFKAQGGDVKFVYDSAQSAVTINGAVAKPVALDIQTGNGVIHVFNAIISPAR